MSTGSGGSVGTYHVSERIEDGARGLGCVVGLSLLGEGRGGSEEEGEDADGEELHLG